MQYQNFFRMLSEMVFVLSRMLWMMVALCLELAPLKLLFIWP